MTAPEFDSFAQSYDEILENSLGRKGPLSSVEYFAEGKAQYIWRLLGDRFMGTILDYGCGHGRVARQLLKLFPAARIHGYDISAKTIDAAEETLRRQVLLTSVEADLLPDYDLLVVAGVLHHVQPGERVPFMAALRDRLSPSGRLLVFEHNPLNPVTRRIVAHCIIDRGAVLSTPTQTSAVMAAAGLRATALDYISFAPPRLRCLRPLERFLSRCPLGAQYVMTARHANEHPSQEAA